MLVHAGWIMAPSGRLVVLDPRTIDLAVPDYRAGSMTARELVPLLEKRRCAFVVENVPTEWLAVWTESDSEDGEIARVAVGLREGDASRKECVGGVDSLGAQFLIADAEAVAQWEQTDTLDGLADFVCWGRDVAEVCESRGVPRLSEGEYGWTNLPIDDALRLGAPLEELAEQGQQLFRTDFRPHSHFFQLLQQMRDSSSQSIGFVEVAGTRVCGVSSMSSGARQDVEVTFSDDGTALGVWLELG